MFRFSQDELGIPQGSIRATVLIENILAAFEMDEILFELRNHSAGLNCGRWDYIFSLIRKFRTRPDFLLPDRAEVRHNARMDDGREVTPERVRQIIAEERGMATVASKLFEEMMLSPDYTEFLTVTAYEYIT